MQKCRIKYILRRLYTERTSQQKVGRNANRRNESGYPKLKGEWLGTNTSITAAFSPP